MLARADGHVAAVVPRARLKVDSGIAVTGRTLHDEALDAFAREVARPIGLTTVANVQVKERRRGAPGAARGQPALPGHDAADDRQRASTCRRWRSARRSATPIPDGPLPFQEIAMVRYFEERFFAFDDIADAPGATPRGSPRERRAQDMHVHSTFSDGRDPLEENVAEAEALGLTALGCVDHVRADTDWVPEYVAAVRRAARDDTACALHVRHRGQADRHRGALDLPRAVDGVDAILAADHQVPLADGPAPPARRARAASRPARSTPRT